MKIMAVKNGSLGEHRARAGLNTGMTVVSINGTPIDDADVAATIGRNGRVPLDDQDCHQGVNSCIIWSCAFISVCLFVPLCERERAREREREREMRRVSRRGQDRRKGMVGIARFMSLLPAVGVILAWGATGCNIRYENLFWGDFNALLSVAFNKILMNL